VAPRGILIAAVLAAGCSTTSSEDVSTGSMWPRFQVVQTGDTVVAQAMLRTGGPSGTVVVLSGADHFEVEGVVMTEWMDSVTDYTWSRAVIDATPDGVYEIALVRADGDVTTAVEMPARPTITATEPPDVVGTLQPLTVHWDVTEPADAVEVKIEGSCVQGFAIPQIADNGTYTTQALQDGGTPSDCDIAVTVIRGATRGISAAFQGGWSETYRPDSTTIAYDSIAGS
jgi:hypothetical protein